MEIPTTTVENPDGSKTTREKMGMWVVYTTMGKTGEIIASVGYPIHSLIDDDRELEMA